MTRCGSVRECRLWRATAALVVAIYATLGLTGALADWLGRQRLLEQTFFWVFVVFVVALIVVALGRRPRGLEIAVIVAMIAAYTMILLRIGLPTERSHMIEYGLVGVLVYEALVERAASGLRVVRPAILAIGITTVIGVVDELIQLLLPSRVFDPVDIGFNFLAGAMAVASVVALRRVRDRRPGRVSTDA